MTDSAIKKRNGRPPLSDLKALNPNQRKAAQMLSEGFTGKVIAEKLGVRPNTISDWNNRCPAFQNYLGELRAMTWMVQSGIGSRAAHGGLIYAAQVIADKSANTRDRLSAVATVLAHQRATFELEMRSRQIAAVEERLKAIEARQQQAIEVEVHQLSPSL